jgi:hypothetical protein
MSTRDMYTGNVVVNRPEGFGFEVVAGVVPEASL